MEILPGLLFLVLVLTCIGAMLWVSRQRRLEFQALAEKFALQDARFDPNAPDPKISGLFFPATYPRFLMGTLGTLLGGVNVVAFDYRIRGFRGQRLGAGVGVKALVDVSALQPTLRSGLDVSQNSGWTFVYKTPLPFMRVGYGMGPEEMEVLLRKLLMAPALAPAERPKASPPMPGGVHIRPRHRL